MTAKPQPEKFEPQDTAFIQSMSLQHFMGGIGYKQDGKQFVTDNNEMSHLSRLSYRTAVQLHNLPVSEWVYKDDVTLYPVLGKRIKRTLVLGLGAYALQKLQATKLVQTVKLQMTKNGYLDVQCHEVKPQTPILTFALGLTS